MCVLSKPRSHKGNVLFLQVHRVGDAMDLPFNACLTFCTTTESESSDDLDRDGFFGEENLDSKRALDVSPALDVNNSWDDLDPSLYTSKTFFSFDEKTYSLMVQDLAGRVRMSLQVIKEHDARGLMDLKKWSRIKDQLSLCQSVDTQQRYLCLKSTGLKIAYLEDWAHIIRAAHCPSGHNKHLGVAATINAIKLEWCIEKRKHGMSLDYIKDSVITCGGGCMLIKEESIAHDFSLWPSCNHSTAITSTSIETTMSLVEQNLTEIMIKHQTRLVLVRSTKKHGSTKWLQEYMCHRGGIIF